VGQELKLLREDKLAAVFRKAMSRGDNSIIAVPFWGRGAVATLGLTSGARLRVICNLDHPGCNPDVIAELRKLKIKVKTHPRLHAKIYATPDLAIVGSSNVSTNGLTVEGSGAKGWIEANVASTDPAFVKSVIDLFMEVWNDEASRMVSKGDIKAARDARKARPPMLYDLPRRASLFDSVRTKPDSFSNVFVAAYTTGLGVEGKRLLKEVRSGATQSRAGLSASDFRRAWGYQFESIPEGAWLVDLDCKDIDKPKVHGCAKATGLSLSVESEDEDENDLAIALQRMISIGGRSFPLLGSEKDKLCTDAKRILKAARGKLLPITDAVAIIDRRK
jgi:hypothetical protein